MEPAVPLGRVLSEWHEISRSLAEPIGQGLNQVSNHFRDNKTGFATINLLGACGRSA